VQFGEFKFSSTRNITDILKIHANKIKFTGNCKSLNDILHQKCISLHNPLPLTPLCLSSKSRL
jgi:hypothetical protein